MRLYVIIFSFVFLLCACQKDEDVGSTDQTFDEGVRSLSLLDQPEPLAEPKELEVVEEPAVEDGYECSVKSYEAAAEYNEMLLLDPASDVIYPGAVIVGESIATGEYIPIIAERKPMSLSVSLQNIDGSPKATIDNPSLSNVRVAINEILSSNVTGGTAAKVSFEIEEVHSQSQLSLALGANYKSAMADVSGSFDFSQEDVRSRVVVKFVQAYYTIDIDLPAMPSDLFSEMPNLNSLGGVSPMYVSTITYGRMAIFTAESSQSTTELKASLNAAFSSGTQEGKVSVSAEQRNVIENARIQATIIGGSGSDAVGAVQGIEGLTQYILGGGDYTKDSPGAPLSYKLRYLKDNSIGNIVLATQYNVRSCDRVAFSYRVTAEHIYVNDDGEPGPGDFYGYLATWSSQGSRHKLWERGEDRDVKIETDETFNIDETKQWTFTKPDTDEDYIEVGGHMYEDEGINSRDLGFERKRFTLNNIPKEPIKVVFTKFDTKITVSYRISPVY